MKTKKQNTVYSSPVDTGSSRPEQDEDVNVAPGTVSYAIVGFFVAAMLLASLAFIVKLVFFA